MGMVVCGIGVVGVAVRVGDGWMDGRYKRYIG